MNNGTFLCRLPAFFCSPFPSFVLGISSDLTWYYMVHSIRIIWAPDNSDNHWPALDAAADILPLSWYHYRNIDKWWTWCDAIPAFSFIFPGWVLLNIQRILLETTTQTKQQWRNGGQWMTDYGCHSRPLRGRRHPIPQRCVSDSSVEVLWDVYVWSCEQSEYVAWWIPLAMTMWQR